MICDNCKKEMRKVCSTGSTIQEGEYRKQENSEFSIWHLTGERPECLYQCDECKKILAG